jgi:hypothetical protein
MRSINIIGLVLAMVATSCADLEQIPDGTNTTVSLFKNQKDAEAAVNGMYSALQSQNLYNQYNENLQSQGTDDAEWGFGRNTNNTDKLAVDKFTYTASTNLVYLYWRTLYQNINRANLAIKYIAPMNIPEEKKKQYLGEAHFIRGLMYFTLVRLYGEVPLVLTATENLDDLEVAKESITKVYDQILSDFQNGKSNLPLTYQAVDRGRATKGAAMAMLAKLYLTRQEWQKAADETQEIIALGTYSLWPTYEEVFKIANKNIRESIFEIQYRSLGSIGNSNGSTYNGFFRPPANVLPPPAGKFAGYGDNPVTENHYKSYAPGDTRREVNVRYFPDAPKSILYPYYVNKYQDPNAFNVNDGGNNYYIARYADILLMNAEALHELQAGSTIAYDRFNQVRRRAFGVPLNAPSAHDLPSGLTQQQFRDSVLTERRREFAFEGHRRFDLIRMGKLKEAMAKQDPSIKVEDRHLLLPIPQDELIVNPLLKQNLGY